MYWHILLGILFVIAVIALFLFVLWLIPEIGCAISNIKNRFLNITLNIILIVGILALIAGITYFCKNPTTSQMMADLMSWFFDYPA